MTSLLGIQILTSVFESAVVLKLSLERPERIFENVSSIKFPADFLGFPLINGNRVLLALPDGFLLWNVVGLRSLPRIFRWKCPHLPVRRAKVIIDPIPV